MHGVKETEKRQTGEKGGMISQILLFVCTRDLQSRTHNH